MSLAGVYPTDSERIRARHRVRLGEYKRWTFVECAGNWRANTAFWEVRTLIWTLDGDTRKTQKGGVNSDVLSTRWATPFIGPYTCATNVASGFSGRRLVHQVQRKSTGMPGRRFPRVAEEINPPLFTHPRALGAGENAALYFILRLNCYFSLGPTALCVTFMKSKVK